MVQLYTVPETAKLLRVKKSYVYELIYTGQLKAIRLSERRFRVREQAIVEFIERKEKEMVLGN
ncbi:MAG: helix-turn-helix domain-containing protein [Syntrophaceticus sp.]